jgi:hypothetical protein
MIAVLDPVRDRHIGANGRTLNGIRLKRRPNYSFGATFCKIALSGLNSVIDFSGRTLSSSTRRTSRA